MAEIDDIRAYVQAQTGKDPDTERALCKNKTLGIFCAEPGRTYVRTSDGGTWCCMYRNSEGEWTEQTELRKEPGTEYSYGEETRVVPDWKSIL